MSTLLQLTNYAREECDASGNGDLTTLVGVTGESSRFKNWIIRSWEEIQEMQADWKWMRAAFSFVTTANDGTYTSAQAGISSRFGRWDRTYCTVYLTASGTADQAELEWVDYEEFRSSCLTQPISDSRPTHFSIGDANELLLWPVPDSALYTIKGDYFKSPQILSADTDEPELPEQHRVIAYSAMKKYARFSASPEIYADASEKERMILSQFRAKYLPAFYLVGS
ncbi:MAG: hypothetical protein UW69_C0070G0002 [Microgenomates group bacterium GW2011_GWA2_44_7]|nr:MAG: hypothetical protein UW69_C0070G0002 [Microgenomates group bacterium GW2011_GWA2_44_7]